MNTDATNVFGTDGQTQDPSSPTQPEKLHRLRTPVSLLIATANTGKAKEFREMLGGDQFTWSDLSTQPSPPKIEETGRTFRENACIKASEHALHYKRWTLADDSGLEVDALNGSPGVYSARWAEMNGAGRGDSANNALLLQQLADVPDSKRVARFVCVLALSDPQGRIVLTARDFVAGRILRSARGGNGFGYDPLFLIEELGLTTAELEPAQKHAISHRGKALRTLREMMRKLMSEK
jgi:XTP/dITP diphosphohydrolase